MKTLGEYKQYYSNATKEEVIEDSYLDYKTVIELQQRIDKAMEYIEKRKFKNRDYPLKDIKEILKGESNE